MSKPAARIGDMHVCPMVTPGTPPIPHVGGPIAGPGCATVWIGGMPAAVLGDMCVCTGPPDTIILGSTGVLIGGKPAARMGDMCAHGGSIVVGCPTVLIGEISPAGMALMRMVLLAILLKIKGFEGGEAGGLAVRQMLSLQQAAVNGAAFCEVCEANKNNNGSSGSGASRGGTANAPGSQAVVEEKVKKINAIYFTDSAGNRITEVKEEETVMLTIEGENIAGEEVLITLYDNAGDFTYQGNDIENDQLTLSLSGNDHKVELGIKITTK
ncbi:MAG: PAAR domain-containing protein [Flavobacteriales bacterium]|nr:PAAR domain-containing protein [Flavobacteriales bacterium]